MTDVSSSASTSTSSTSTSSTSTSRLIKASRETIYRAFTEPTVLATWLAPEGMTGQVHEFDDRVGGGYQMSLYYPSTAQGSRGKSAEMEDRYTARFVELTPPSKIVSTITFDTKDPAFAGEMTMRVTLVEKEQGTEVTIVFENIPSGIRPEDNDTGTRSSLEKLARYVE